MYSNREASGPEEASGPRGGFVHQASIYGSDEEFMDVAMPFVEEAIAFGEPTLAAVPERNLEKLTRALDGAPPGVTLTSNRRWYETSAQTREKFRRWVLEQLDRDGDRRVRLIGEPPWAVGHEAQVRD
ncbi:MAG: MEDS domain-containing protein, partial [Solirubrobacterales bacterium]